MFNKEKFINQQLNEYSNKAWVLVYGHKNEKEYHDYLVDKRRLQIEAEVTKSYYRFYCHTLFNSKSFWKQFSTIVIVFMLIFSVLIYQYIKHDGIFDRPFKISSSLYTINFPAQPKETSKTYGSASQALIVTNYIASYPGFPSGNQSNFQFNVTDFQGYVNQQKLSKTFSSIVRIDLNQTYLNTTNPILSESIVSQENSIYDGYPSINASLTSDYGNIHSQERFILVGNVIYWLKATQSSGDQSDLQHYANTLKFL